MYDCMAELKLVKRTVRLTETMDRQIMEWPGKNFSKRITGMLDFCLNKGPEIRKEIEQLILEREELRKRIETLRQIESRMETVRDALEAVEELCRDRPENENSNWWDQESSCVTGKNI